MKKIIAIFFAVAALFVGQSVFASALWNGASNDCPTVSIANYTTNTGYGNPCWQSSSVNASAGDSINVRIYYHNSSDYTTNSQTATNVRIQLNAPTGTGSTQTFTGSIVSDQGSLSFGPVTAYIPSGSSLSFGSAKWYPNQTQTQMSFPNGQSTTGIETIQGGVNIGSVAPGWSTQGSVVISFLVSNQTQPSPTCQDRSATNYGGALPCQYYNPPQICHDRSATNYGGTLPCQYYNPPQVCQDRSAINYGGALPCQYYYNPPVQSCTISYFNASPTYVTSGNSSTLSWNTQNCTWASIAQVGSVNVGSSSTTVYPYATTTYILNASGSNGSSDTRSITVSVNQQQQQQSCYITSFTASPTYVIQNQSVTLNWNTQNCSSATVSGPGITNTGLSGSQTIYPTYSASYVLTAYSYSGAQQSQTVYVSVNQQNNNYNYCTISYFTASPNYVTAGQPVTLTWNTQNCTSASISGIGNVNVSGSQIVYPSYTTNYTLNAYGYNSTQQSQSVSINVNPLVVPTQPIVNACAVTTVATNVSQGSATLNGLVSNANYYNSTGWFEYGTTTALGNRTNTQTISGSTFSQVISGLTADTVYYFRFVANCGGSQSSGAQNVFETLANTVVRPVVVQGTTVVGTASPIMLTIEDRYELIGTGDTVDYTVHYKNIGRSKLTHPVLQIIAPKGITITNASAGTYSADTNTLTVPLDDLTAGTEGTVYLQARVDSLPTGSAQIVTTAILVYTTPSGAQENAIAYVLNKPRDLTNVLGASAFWAGIFPTTLVGWLLLIILILIVILLARRFSHRDQAVHTYHSVPPPPAQH